MKWSNADVPNFGWHLPPGVTDADIDRAAGVCPRCGTTLNDEGHCACCEQGKVETE